MNGFFLAAKLYCFIEMRNTFFIYLWTICVFVAFYSKSDAHCLRT